MKFHNQQTKVAVSLLKITKISRQDLSREISMTIKRRRVRISIKTNKKSSKIIIIITIIIIEMLKIWKNLILMK